MKRTYLNVICVIICVLSGCSPNYFMDSSESALSDVSEKQFTAVSINIKDHYITNPGFSNNIYYIDDNNVLWGAGYNNFGQLGQGNQDEEFTVEFVKIAENVVHVDRSQRGFVIFLTEDNKLYGFGAGGNGALRNLNSVTGISFINGAEHAVTSPQLLMEDLVYAVCGRDDIVAIDKQGNCWTWGTIWHKDADHFEAQVEPKKILSNVQLVTGGFYNHAALLTDGSLWTWGYNFAGNCGTDSAEVLSNPVKVSEGVTMVWTGKKDHNIGVEDIREIQDHEGEEMIENTIIQKSDGEYMACGVGIGGEEKILEEYYGLKDYPMICSHDFQVYNFD